MQLFIVMDVAGGSMGGCSSSFIVSRQQLAVAARGAWKTREQFKYKDHLSRNMDSYKDAKGC